MEDIIQWSLTNIIWLSYQYGEFSETNLEDLMKDCWKKKDLIRDLQHQFEIGRFCTIA